MANPQKENGAVMIANEIVEALAKTYMSSYESQIVWVLFRKTYGFNKKDDWIANHQFVEMTGIHKAHVSRTIKKLISRNIVTQMGNKYRFQKDYTSWLELPKQVTNKKLPKQVTKVTQMGTTVTQIGKGVTQIGGHKIQYTKDTNTKYNTSNSSNEEFGHELYKAEVVDEVEEGVVELRDTNYFIDLFKEVNPTYNRLFKNKSQRSAIENVMKSLNHDDLERYIKSLKDTNIMPYAPRITTPIELENKIGNLISFLKQQEKKINKFSVTQL